MKNKPDSADLSLSETMAARIEVNDAGDPAHQKKITDAVEALDGVIETEAEKEALGLVGLIPDVTETEDVQLQRVLMQLGHKVATSTAIST
jgi:hypothetical protein